MGFRTGAWATVWAVDQMGKWTKVRISVSKKDKETNTYEEDFSGFCMFIGNAAAKAEKLKERDRIRLGDIDVSRKWDKEKQKEYINYKVFSFETEAEAGGNGGGGNAAGQTSTSASSENPMDYNPVDHSNDDELPF